jgi:CubicO group peptidase (beta-lactamase class C family)
LPKPIYEYTPTKKWHDKLYDLKSDTLYRRITAECALDHTTGFPNWRWYEEDRKLRVKFIPGSKYSYSGEGLFISRWCSSICWDRTLEDIDAGKLFKPLGMNRSSYTWQQAFEMIIVLDIKHLASCMRKTRIMMPGRPVH